MPRPPRIWFPDALYHLMVRGDNREPIFFVEADYRTYLDLLGEAKRRYECRLFAYALMTNHVHLMLQTGSHYSVSKIMQFLNTAYTTSINRRHHRVGHLFQGRYRSVLVDKDAYLLELSRYIHLNPVRAGLVSRSEDYPWSSYRAYLREGPDELIDTREVLAMISPSATARQRYQEFVRDGLASADAMERRLLARRSILGSADFVSRARSAAIAKGV